MATNYSYNKSSLSTGEDRNRQKDVFVPPDFGVFYLGTGNKAAVAFPNQLYISRMMGRTAQRLRAEVSTHLILLMISEIALVSRTEYQHLHVILRPESCRY